MNKLLIVLLLALGFPREQTQPIIHYCKTLELAENTFDYIRNLAWSPDGQRLAIATENSIEVWELESNELENIFKNNKLNAYLLDLSWSQDSSKIAVATNLSVSVLDAQSKDMINSWKPSDDKQEIFFVDWKPDDDRIAIRTSSEIILWDFSDNRVATTIPVKNSFSDQIKWSPDGTFLAFSDSYTMNIWNSNTGDIEDTFTIGNNAYAFEWSPDSTKIAVHIVLEGIRIFDIKENDYIKVLGGSPILWFDSTHLITAYGHDPNRHLVMWDGMSWEQDGTVRIEDKLTYLEPIVMKPGNNTIALPDKHATSVMVAEYC